MKELTQIRLNLGTKAKLRKIAKEQGLTLNALLTTIINEYLNK